MVEPITCVILLAVATLLSGGGTYAVTKAKAQKRIMELQDMIEELQGALIDKQARIVELQQQLADAQNRLVERENRLAAMIEREKKLQQVVKELGRRIEVSSNWWRKALAVLLFRYRQLVEENRSLRLELDQNERSLGRTAELREGIQTEIDSLEGMRRMSQLELQELEKVVIDLWSNKGKLDEELVQLL
jgi:peptidoglycan hydrolase CwlO-like protein